MKLAETLYYQLENGNVGLKSAFVGDKINLPAGAKEISLADFNKTISGGALIEKEPLSYGADD